MNGEMDACDEERGSKGRAPGAPTAAAAAGFPFLLASFLPSFLFVACLIVVCPFCPANDSFALLSLLHCLPFPFLICSVLLLSSWPSSSCVIMEPTWKQNNTTNGLSVSRVPLPPFLAPRVWRPPTTTTTMTRAVVPRGDVLRTDLRLPLL